MKNTIKLLGIIAFILVIGFSFTVCDNGDGNVNGGTGNQGNGNENGNGNGNGNGNVNIPVNMEMVQIPTGTLTWEAATITLNMFKMGKYEVTQEQYQAVMGTNPSNFNSKPATGEVQGKRPVETVTWFDAIEFCNKLSTREGLTPVYTITGRNPATGYPITVATVEATWTNNGYRLPTEAQWEYACRAGSTADYGMGASNTQITVANLKNYAWYNANYDPITHEVGKKTANAFGLYDMHGNVDEWCWDWYGTLPSTNETDYKGAVSGSKRVLRGGSWMSPDTITSSTHRSNTGPSFKHETLGFRLVRP